MRRWLPLVLAAFLAAGCGGPAAAPAAAPPDAGQAGASPTATPPPAVAAADATPSGAAPQPPGAGAPAAPAGDAIQVCVERAAGMTIQRVVEAAGGSLEPGRLADGPLAQAISADAVKAVEACFAGIAAPSAPPGGPGPTGSGVPGVSGPGAPPASLREVTAEEKAALQATADRVRASSVVVGEILNGAFAPGGSGFVYSSDGLVMTNSHVLLEVKGTPQVMLADGRVLPAERVGRVTSIHPDVAVLRVRGSGLTVAELGDSDTVRFGDPLLAIAHPRGYGYWLAVAGQAYGQLDTSGPGAATAMITELYSNVPSSQGASGGPLFNAAGQVVGLLFAGSSEGEPEAITPPPLTVIRDPLQWSAIARRARTTAVAINDALGAAREIVARGGDVPDWTPASGPTRSEVAGSIPGSVVEAVAAPGPAADDERVLALVRPLIPSIVHVIGRTGGTTEQGTGQVITADGYILTNAHVIDDTANTYEVTLSDGRRFTARRVGIVTSQSPDVGVLKVDATGLQPLAVGDPAALRPGDPLYLVGHPKDRGYWRLSTGPFHAAEASGGHTQLLASLSFAAGNSGGAFLNERGEMVGVFHGTPPTSAAAIRASAPEVVWGWHEFDQLFGEGNARARLAAAAAIDVAMARAQQIIQRQGDLP